MKRGFYQISPDTPSLPHLKDGYEKNNSFLKLGSQPILFKCPNCYQTRMTTVKHNNGNAVYLASGTCCTMGCLACASGCIFSWIYAGIGAIFCLGGTFSLISSKLKDSTHWCSGCEMYVGIYKSL